MKLKLQHNRLLAILTLIIFLSGSSGFTMVVTTCLMESESCCQIPASMSDNGCDNPLQKSEVRVLSDMSCQSTSIVGGLKVDPATSDKNFKDGSAKLPHVTGLLSSNFASNNFSSPHFLLSSSFVPLPPSVDRYVLNASFLI
jgi:hypothetical protein